MTEREMRIEDTVRRAHASIHEDSAEGRKFNSADDSFLEISSNRRIESKTANNDFSASSVTTLKTSEIFEKTEGDVNEAGLSLDASEDIGVDWLLDDSSISTDEEACWEEVMLQDNFVDIEDEQLEYDDVKFTDSLTTHERARQIVGELTEEFSIDEILFEELVECLSFHKCHGQTRLALHRLLSQNVSATELALIFKLRAYWSSNDGFTRTYYGNRATIGYINLSWVLGLAIVRSLGVDDIYEASMFIEDCFDDWSSSLVLINGFHSFRAYLYYLVEHRSSVSPLGFPSYIDYQYFADEEGLPADFPGSSVYKWLEENNQLHWDPTLRDHF